MHESLACEQTAARCALHETLLHQERLDDLLNGIARMAECRGDGLDTDRSAPKGIRDRLKIAPVESIEAAAINFEARQCGIGDLCIDRDVAGDRCEIAHTLEKSTCDPRRAARPARDFA